jgi:hypothetical protein
VNIAQELIDDGLMEYISIPWSNAWEPGALPDQQAWTINLALWFVHILAGTHFEAAREYLSLDSETLIHNEPVLSIIQASGAAADSTSANLPGVYGAAGEVRDVEEDSDYSGDTNPIEISPFPRKRKIESLARDEDEDDRLHWSFHKRSFVAVSE